MPFLAAAAVVLAFAAAVAAEAPSGADSDCSLSALRLWGEGSLLRLEPAFSPDVLRYKAALDHHASALWVDAKTSSGDEASSDGGGCQARRSDGGLQEGVDGEVTVAVAGADGRNPQKYAVALTRRAGDDADLEALALQGEAASKLAPAYSPGTLEYSTEVTGDDGSLVELSCGPADMGQSLRVSLESPQPVQAPEVPSRLEQLLFRRRNFTLGKVVTGGAELQFPGSQRGHKLPIRAKIEVWPVSAAGDAPPQGSPARTYVVVLKPRSGLVAAGATGHAGGASGGSGQSREAGSHWTFGFFCAAILGSVFVIAFRNSPEAPPEESGAAATARGQGEENE